MDLAIAVTVFGVLFALLALGAWVAISLLIVAGVSLMLFANVPMGQLLATSGWSSVASYPLTALPLFIWMGEILTRSRLSSDLFTGLAPWLGRMPGGLVHANIYGCGLFAAVSGSSAATCATVGRMTVPELRKRGYDDDLILGTLAGSATLGLLIPPSIILIVYGVATEQSIARLFIAGVVPGLVLIAMFTAYVMFRSRLDPKLMPAAEAALPIRERLRQTRSLAPVAILIAGIIGSIYGGVASPTDAAAVGIALSLLFVWISGDLTWRVFRDGLIGATRTTCMIAFIVAGASFLSAAMGFIGLPRNLAAWIGGLGLPPYALIAALTMFFIVIGCILDGISIVILTTAIMLPMVTAAGIDPIWFGIFLVIAVEMSQITPPVGFNLFVIQGMTGVNIFRIARAALPFFFLMLGCIVLMVVFPGMATWLPATMMSR
ncbi:TRAP transporter large permease subunit [Actibacterium sp. MT2.3-13A]|uniref:TRAP transporter large permease n=1 Tax=Actibacterium sp. MT2.3-13A TaxID=2828332 RepID=UPI001BAA2132|nr:TRAP transporter large permease subunit [Actibacterium sp. MT2.3-13A]